MPLAGPFVREAVKARRQAAIVATVLIVVPPDRRGSRPDHHRRDDRSGDRHGRRFAAWRCGPRSWSPTSRSCRCRGDSARGSTKLAVPRCRPRSAPATSPAASSIAEACAGRHAIAANCCRSLHPTRTRLAPTVSVAAAIVSAVRRADRRRHRDVRGLVRARAVGRSPGRHCCCGSPRSSASRVEQRSADEQRRTAEAAAVATDLVTALRTVKGIGAEQTATAKYVTTSQTLRAVGDTRWAGPPPASTRIDDTAERALPRRRSRSWARSLADAGLDPRRPADRRSRAGPVPRRTVVAPRIRVGFVRSGSSICTSRRVGARRTAQHRRWHASGERLRRRFASSSETSATERCATCRCRFASGEFVAVVAPDAGRRHGPDRVHRSQDRSRRRRGAARRHVNDASSIPLQSMQ